MNIDQKDRDILEKIQKHPSSTTHELSKLCNLPSSSIHDRLKKLKEKSILLESEPKINLQKCGISIQAFIKLKINSANWSESLSQQLKSNIWVQEIHEIIGEDSYLLKIIAKDTDHLSTILKTEIAILENIKETQTTLILKTVKDTKYVPMI